MPQSSLQLQFAPPTYADHASRLSPELQMNQPAPAPSCARTITQTRKHVDKRTSVGGCQWFTGIKQVSVS
jgi:hypothetical protein